MKKWGAVAVIFAASLWAIDSAFLRPSLYSLNSFLVVFLEHIIAFTFMFPLLMFELKELKKMKKSDWWTMFLIALFGGAIGTIAITEAFFGVFKYQVSSIATVVILQKTQPIFAVLLARLILKERMKKSFIYWFSIALIGSYLNAFGLALPVIEFKAIYVPCLAILASISFATGTVLGRKILNRINNRVATYLRFGLTSLITFSMIILFFNISTLKNPSIQNIQTLLLIAFTTGGVAIMIYYWGLKHVKASQAAIYELGFPVTAIFLDYFVHDHIFTSIQWFGALLIIVAMFNVARSK